MARKRSPFEDLIDIAAMLPWWAGVLVALISYFVLHHFASAVVTPPSASPGQIGDMIVNQLGKTLALFGQYLLPLAFLIGAGVSAYGRYKRAGLFAGIQKASSPSVLNGMTWQEFEMLVGEAFRRKGYTVSETSGGADGGIDLILKKDGEKFLVQCKQWKAYKVGVTVIRELYGVMAAGGAAGGFVVTSGVFTQEAKAFAEGRNIDLIDGSELTAIIQKHQPQMVTTTRSGPKCPKCSGIMVKRTARQGANAGRPFWGCSAFPQCRGIISID